MKLSIFTTVTNPAVRGDHYKQSLDCFVALADEVVIVNGGDYLGYHDQKIRTVSHPWPREFPWTLIGEQFQRGYEAATGDWVLHMDLDFIFHEDDFKAIRAALQRYDNHPALSFYKWQFILPDRYNLKSRLILAVNKKHFGQRIKFDGGGISDLCQPSLDGKLITLEDVPEARVPFYNYEKIAKNWFQIMDDCGRMDRAYHQTFGKYQLSYDGSDEAAFDGYISMLRGRIKKAGAHIPLSKHPKYMQSLIRKLELTQFGYNGFGILDQDNDYLGEYSYA